MRLAFLPRALALAATLACGAAGPPPPDILGRWTGTLHTLQGNCPDQHSSTLVIDRRHLSFAPADGVLVLHGNRTADPAHLHAQLLLPGVDHKPVPMVLEAHPDGRAITGLYGTPSCRAEIRLERPEDRPLQRALGR